MNINLIGSNGSLASAIGRYCNKRGHHLTVFGRSVPRNYECDAFRQVDLMTDALVAPELYDAENIIYAAGAGVQSYKGDSFESIYKLNVEVPIVLHTRMLQSGGG